MSANLLSVLQFSCWSIAKGMNMRLNFVTLWQCKLLHCFPAIILHVYTFQQPILRPLVAEPIVGSLDPYISTSKHCWNSFYYHRPNQYLLLRSGLCSLLSFLSSMYIHIFHALSTNSSICELSKQCLHWHCCTLIAISS